MMKDSSSSSESVSISPSAPSFSGPLLAAAFVVVARRHHRCCCCGCCCESRSRPPPSAVRRRVRWPAAPPQWPACAAHTRRLRGSCNAAGPATAALAVLPPLPLRPPPPATDGDRFALLLLLRLPCGCSLSSAKEAARGREEWCDGVLEVKNGGGGVDGVAPRRRHQVTDLER